MDEKFDMFADFFSALEQDNKEQRQRFYMWLKRDLLDKCKGVKAILGKEELDVNALAHGVMPYDLEDLCENVPDFDKMGRNALDDLVALYKRAIDDVDLREPNDDELLSCKQQVLYRLQDNLQGASTALFNLQ